MRQTGKGKTVYLAFANEYATPPAAAPDIAPVFKRVLDAVGFPEPEVKVQDADGKQVLCQVLRHRRGDGKPLFFGLLRRDGLAADGKPCKVTLPGEFHIYDLLKGGLVASGPSFEFNPIPGIGNLYAALPYEVKRLDLSCPETAAAGGQLHYGLEVVATGAKPGYHVFRLEVLNPEGKEEKCYTANLEAPDGSCKGALDLALNALPGKWTLKARDVLTGAKAQRTFEVGE